MSNTESKKRTSASLRLSTIEKIEQYQEVNDLDNRSEAIESIINTHEAFETHGGAMSALMAIAGDTLPAQFRQLGWFAVATAVMLLTLDAGIIGSYVWGGLAALFGFLTIFTAIGVVAGVVGLTDPDPVGMPDPADNTDEVEA